MKARGDFEQAQRSSDNSQLSSSWGSRVRCRHEAVRGTLASGAATPPSAGGAGPAAGAAGFFFFFAAALAASAVRRSCSSLKACLQVVGRGGEGPSVRGWWEKHTKGETKAGA